jgi:hypothetical protein
MGRVWGLSAPRPVVPSDKAGKGSSNIIERHHRVLPVAAGAGDFVVLVCGFLLHGPDMLKPLPRLMLPLFAALSLAACSAPGLPEQLPFLEPGVSFTVVPSGVGCTSTGSYRGKVSWEVPASMTSKVEIQVRGQERQIFARSNEPVGSEETGVWVSKGMLFALIDRNTDMLLAAIEAGPGQCDAAPAGEGEGDTETGGDSADGKPSEGE